MEEMVLNKKSGGSDEDNQGRLSEEWLVGCWRKVLKSKCASSNIQNGCHMGVPGLFLLEGVVRMEGTTRNGKLVQVPALCRVCRSWIFLEDITGRK